MLKRIFNDVIGASDDEELDDSRRTVLKKAAAGGVALGMLPAATGGAAGQETIPIDDTVEPINCEEGTKMTCPDEEDLNPDPGQQVTAPAPEPEPVCNSGRGICSDAECCSDDCRCDECRPVPKRPKACRSVPARCGLAGFLGSRCECECA